MLDLSQFPDDIRRHIRHDTAAILRHIWQTDPKTLTTEPEEEPDDHH